MIYLVADMYELALNLLKNIFSFICFFIGILFQLIINILISFGNYVLQNFEVVFQWFRDVVPVLSYLILFLFGIRLLLFGMVINNFYFFVCW